METSNEAIVELETKLAEVKTCAMQALELLADMKRCEGDTTKSLIFQAAKKYASKVMEFKL